MISAGKSISLNEIAHAHSSILLPVIIMHLSLASAQDRIGQKASWTGSRICMCLIGFHKGRAV